MASTITPYGLGKIAAAAQSNTQLGVTSIAIGDGAATTTGIGGTNVYNITSGITTSVDNTDPAHPMIKVQGTIPSTEDGGFTIASIALMDGANVIAVADGSGDTMHGSESPTPQAYSVTFLLPLSNAANFSVIQSVGGNYLPLAGGTMDENAEVILPASATGPENANAATAITGEKVSITKGTGVHTKLTEIKGGLVRVQDANQNFAGLEDCCLVVSKFYNDRHIQLRLAPEVIPLDDNDIKISLVLEYRVVGQDNDAWLGVGVLGASVSTGLY